MKSNLDWKRFAVCLKDKNSSHWLSYNIEHIEYAKKGCDKCPVRAECLDNAINQEIYVGVNGGISEWDFLNKTWKKVTNAKRSNWSRSSATLHKLLQKKK